MNRVRSFVSSRSVRQRASLEALEGRRLFAAGDLDTSFSGDGKAEAFDALRNRYVSDVEIVAGNKTLISGASDGNLMLARYNVDGTPDTSFGNSADGRVILPGTGGGSIEVRGDGKIIVVSSYDTSPNNPTQYAPRIVRFNANGTIDSTFGGGDGIVDVPSPFITNYVGSQSVALTAGSKIMLAIDTQNEFVAARLNEDGSLDTTFGGGDGFAVATTTLAESANAIAVAPDGSVFIAGSDEAQPTTGVYRSAVLKFKPDGSGLDTTFGGGDGIVYDVSKTPGNDYNVAYDLAFAGDGKLLVLGSGGALVVTKLDTNTGAFDSGFSGDGQAPVPNNRGFRPDFEVAPDGKIVIGATSSVANVPSGEEREAFNFYVSRLESDGDVDPTWNNGNPAVVDFYRGGDFFNALAVQSDGNVVAAGDTESQSDGTFANTAIARLTTAGTLDTSFSGDGKFGQDFPGFRRTAASVAVQSDGKTIVGGTLRQANASSPTGISDEFFLTRYNANGTLDTGFGNGGTVIRDVFIGQFDVLSDVLVQPNGKILALGSSAGFGRDGDIAVVRFNADGTPDTSFGDGKGRLAIGLGGADAGVELALRSDGDILVSATTNAPGRTHALIRLNANGTRDNGLDGDGILYHNYGTQLAVVADNKVLLATTEPAAGGASQVVVRRLNTSGTTDTNYGVAGRAAGFGADLVDLAARDGRATVLGVTSLVSSVEGYPSTDVAALFRFNANGTPDASFGGGDGNAVYDTRQETNGGDEPAALTIDAQGRIVVTTAADLGKTGHSDFAFDTDLSVLRFTPTGDRDASFGVNGRAAADFNQPLRYPLDEVSAERAIDVVTLPDGRVVALGATVAAGGYGVARFIGTTVTPPPLTGVQIVNGVLRITGTAGNDNIEVFDRGPSPGNVVVTRNGATGTFGRSAFSRIEILGQGGNDTLGARTHAEGYTDLPMLLDGGAGNDTLSGGTGNDTLLGLDGNDYLFGSFGDDLVDGGLGTDVQLGGIGADTIDYSYRNSAVYVDLQGDADDGPAGEKDTVGADFEHILGGKGNDTLVGDDRPNSIQGNAGNDTIRGGGGNDSINGGVGQDKLYGEGGDDFLDAKDGITDLVLDGGTGKDKARKDTNDPTTSIEGLIA